MSFFLQSILWLVLTGGLMALYKHRGSSKYNEGHKDGYNEGRMEGYSHQEEENKKIVDIFTHSQIMKVDEARKEILKEANDKRKETKRPNKNPARVTKR